MERDLIISKVNDLMQSGFELSAERLSPEATLFGDLELDSLDVVDMLVHLEEKMGVKVNSERLMGIKTLGDVYNLVFELAGPQAPGKLSN